MYQLKHRLWFVMICCCVWTTTGHAEPMPMSLVGTYLIEEQGKLREFIRIDYRTGSFFLAENQHGQWSPSVEVWPVSREEFAALLREPVTYSFSGLANDSIGVFRVPRGWQSGNFICQTGFWLMMPIGPVEIIKKQ